MSREEEKEERDIIFSLDSYVILEYIKSSVDIILNLKFEEIEKKLIDKNQNLPHTYANSSKVKPGKVKDNQIIAGGDTITSS